MHCSMVRLGLRMNFKNSNMAEGQNILETHKVIFYLYNTLILFIYHCRGDIFSRIYVRQIYTLYTYMKCTNNKVHQAIY